MRAGSFRDPNQKSGPGAKPDLETSIKRSAGFFAGRLAVLDISKLPPTRPAVTGLMGNLNTREIRAIVIEDAAP